MIDTTMQLLCDICGVLDTRIVTRGEREFRLTCRHCGAGERRCVQCGSTVDQAVCGHGDRPQDVVVLAAGHGCMHKTLA